MLFGCALMGQNVPVIRSQAGVVSAANYTPTDFPGGAIAQGSIFVIFGSNLGPAALTNATSYPLQPALGGVSVAVTQGSTTVAALPLYVYQTQVAAIMPSNAPTGAVQVAVTYQGQTSGPSAAQVTTTNVGLFTVPSSGMGPGAIQDFVNGPLPVNSLTGPAQPGQVVIFWGTGLGPSLNGDDSNVPQAGSLPISVNIALGTKHLSTSYSGRSGCCAGEDEIVFTIPQDGPFGCHVPVQVVTIGGGMPSNIATIAISPDGGPCSDSVDPFGTALTGKNGGVLLTHVDATAGSGAVSLGAAADIAAATFRNDTDTQFSFSPLYSLPTVGTCNVYLSAGNAFGGSPIQGLNPVGLGLDAGTLTVKNGTATDQMEDIGGIYGTLLASSVTGSGDPLFLTGGSYTVSGTGGADVGPFSVTLGDAPKVAWSTSDQSSVVTRSSGLTVNWTVSGGDTSKLVAMIMGGNADTIDNRSEVFLCTASAAAGTFTVPSVILSRVPPTRSGSLGLVGIGMLPTQPQATFQATGLNSGFADSLAMNVQFMTFQ